MLAESASAVLGALVSEISGCELLVLPQVLGGVSRLLVEDGEDFGDALSDSSNTSQLDLCSRRCLMSSQRNKLSLELHELHLKDILCFFSKLKSFNLLVSLVLHYL